VLTKRQSAHAVTWRQPSSVGDWTAKRLQLPTAPRLLRQHDDWRRARRRDGEVLDDE
jgi:hypothetical protein